MKFSLLKELIESKQGQFQPEFQAATPYADHLKTDSYGHYRVMIAAAACSDKETPKDFEAWGPLRDQPFSVPFSQADADMVHLARKLCGIDSKPVAAKGSNEPEQVNRASTHNTKAHSKSWRNLR